MNFIDIVNMFNKIIILITQQFLQTLKILDYHIYYNLKPLFFIIITFLNKKLIF